MVLATLIALSLALSDKSFLHNIWIENERMKLLGKVKGSTLRSHYQQRVIETDGLNNDPSSITTAVAGCRLSG